MSSRSHALARRDLGQDAPVLSLVFSAANQGLVAAVGLVQLRPEALQRVREPASQHANTAKQAAPAPRGTRAHPHRGARTTRGRGKAIDLAVSLGVHLGMPRAGPPCRARGRAHCTRPPRTLGRVRAAAAGIPVELLDVLEARAVLAIAVSHRDQLAPVLRVVRNPVALLSLLHSPPAVVQNTVPYKILFLPHGG